VDLLIIAGNNARPFSSHLPRIVCTVHLTVANRLEQWSKNEVSAVIRRSNARNMSAAEIHRQLLEVYGEDDVSLLSVAK
jgi:hypothetical protein